MATTARGAVKATASALGWLAAVWVLICAAFLAVVVAIGLGWRIWVLAAGALAVVLFITRLSTYGSGKLTRWKQDRNAVVSLALLGLLTGGWEVGVGILAIGLTLATLRFLLRRWRGKTNDAWWPRDREF